jgi:hypothetical protein
VGDIEAESLEAQPQAIKTARNENMSFMVAFLPLGTSSVPQPIFGSNGVRIRPSPLQ